MKYNATQNEQGRALSIHSSSQFGDKRFELDEAFAVWTRAHGRWDDLYSTQQAAQAAQEAALSKADALYSEYSKQRAAAIVAHTQGDPAMYSAADRFVCNVQQELASFHCFMTFEEIAIVLNGWHKMNLEIPRHPAHVAHKIASGHKENQT